MFISQFLHQVSSVCTIALSATVISQVEQHVVLDQSTEKGLKELVRGSEGAGLFVICIAGLAILIEVLIIVLRFLNIGAINLQMRKFFILVSVRCVHDMQVEDFPDVIHSTVMIATL